MYRLVPYIPIVRRGGGGGVVIKSAKRMCICDYIKIALVLVKNEFFELKKGISGLVS